MIPIVTGKFDLSIGYGLGLAHVMVMQLIVNDGWPWPLACLAVIVGGGRSSASSTGSSSSSRQIDSFIATLGTGSMLYAVTGWITDGARIVPGPHGLPAAFTDLYDSTFLGLPVPAFYVLALAVALWLVLERLPLGRYLYVIGSNPRAADLVGIPTRQYTVYAFAGSGLVVGFAGVLLAAQQQIGNPSVGLDYLLPAFVGALLGSTAIKPGRANATGHRRRRRRPRHRPRRHRPARRRVLGDPAVQRRHPAHRRRPGRLLRPPPAAHRRRRDPRRARRDSAAAGGAP